MWHSGGRPSEEPGGGLEVTGSLQKLASFQLCKRALSFSATLPLKWLSVFLREASVCRTAELLPLSLPAAGGSLELPAAPRLAPHSSTQEGEVSSCPTQTHAQSPWHVHTHGHLHAEECTQRCTRLIYMDAGFLMLLIGWLKSKVPALSGAIKASRPG